jgi:hypothetical protein
MLLLLSIYGAGVEPSPKLLLPVIGLLYQPRMIDGDVEQLVEWMNEGIPKYVEKICPKAVLPNTDLTWLDRGSNPCRRGEFAGE